MLKQSYCNIRHLLNLHMNRQIHKGGLMIAVDFVIDKIFKLKEKELPYYQWKSR